MPVNHRLGLRNLQEWQDYEGGLRPGDEWWLFRLLSGKLYWHPADELFSDSEAPIAHAVVTAE